MAALAHLESDDWVNAELDDSFWFGPNDSAVATADPERTAARSLRNPRPLRAPRIARMTERPLRARGATGAGTAVA
jgi:hypothetical protein